MLLAVALAAAALVVAGCGGGGESSGASTAVVSLPETSAAQPAPPPPEPPPAPTIVVKLINGNPMLPGEKGDRIATLQKALVALGYDVGKVDGEYGPSTRKAVLAFQKKHKLGADGVVGRTTVKALNKALRKLAKS
jgi:peptidoglycan hydrolase-like protein with peptidoglycan-binding domain